MSSQDHLEPACTKLQAPAVELDIQGRPRDLGAGFTVRRLLPAPTRRTVGPFIFFDQMGPVRMTAGAGLDVRPHPHINLATVTYLFDGEILHRDSLGSEQVIRPGAVNWMTAGRGIVHSERSPAAARTSGPSLHGLQLWVALPRAHEEVEPAFRHHPADTIPTVELGGARVRIVAGTAYGTTSPVQVLSPLFYLDVQLDPNAKLELPIEHRQRATYVIDGAIACDGHQYVPGTMAVLREGADVCISALAPTRVIILGGAPLDGERFLWWNFVSSSQARIEAAKDDWRAHRFPVVPGDTIERIPLPES